eukprot:3918334-Rhodomonas_salina.1
MGIHDAALIPRRSLRLGISANPPLSLPCPFAEQPMAPVPALSTMGEPDRPSYAAGRNSLAPSHPTATALDATPVATIPGRLAGSLLCLASTLCRPWSC